MSEIATTFTCFVSHSTYRLVPSSFSTVVHPLPSHSINSSTSHLHPSISSPMVPPLEAGASGSKSSPGLSSPVIVPLATSANDIQSEAAERATFLRAKLAQLHQAYVLEKDGVLPPLAVPRPASLQVDPRGPACDMSEFSTLFGPSERSNVVSVRVTIPSSPSST